MRRAATRTMTLVLSAVVMAAGLDAQARPSGGGARFSQHGKHHLHPRVHHRHHRHLHWGLGLGFTFVPFAHPYAWGPGYPVQPPLAYEPRPVPPAPAPVITPQAGQDPAQTEADRRACDREAMAQPSAMADAAVFHRAALACMQARGYAVR